MPRIAGIEIPKEKRTDIALTYLYGIGRKNSAKVLKIAKVDGSKKAKDLTDEEIGKIQKVIEEYKLEGDLRREIFDNIKRLKEIGTFRGLRHGKNLPVRGQNTRRNARTKRGKRVTIGAIKKEVLQKMEPASAQTKPKEGNK